LTRNRNKIFFWVIVFVGVVVYLFINLEVVESGLEHQKLKAKKQEAMNRNKDLKIEYSDVTSPESVEKYARDNLGLAPPSEKQFRYLK